MGFEGNEELIKSRVIISSYLDQLFMRLNKREEREQQGEVDFAGFMFMFLFLFILTFCYAHKSKEKKAADWRRYSTQ